MPDDISTLSRLIQLSVAPVFLLTGIGSLLSVMANRLARIIDRTRELDTERRAAAGIDAFLLEERRSLYRRMIVINRAILLCTLSAFLVAALIAALFLSAFYQVDLTLEAAGAFVVAMIFLVGGLTSFLVEVHLATRYMRQVFRME